MSLTYDRRCNIYPLVEKIVLEAMTYDPNKDDGEFAGTIEDLLCEFVEAIEERSSFDADTQLHDIVRELTKKKTLADLLSWQGLKV